MQARQVIGNDGCDVRITQTRLQREPTRTIFLLPSGLVTLGIPVPLRDVAITPSDGSFIRTLNDDAIDSTQYGSYSSNPTQLAWLGYTTKRDTGFSLQWVDLATGKRLALMSDLGVMDNWQLVLAPDNRTAAIRIGYDVNNISSQAALYLASLEGQHLTKLEDPVGSPAWSPDSARVAFIRRDSLSGNAAIHIASADGALLQGLPLRQPLKGFVLRGWTKCD